MQLDRENTTANQIRRFTGAEIYVADQVLQRTCIVSADRLITDWVPPPVAALSVGDLEVAMGLQPEVILLGTGRRQLFPSPALITAVLTRGIGFEVMDTAAACRTFNILAADYRRVVAVLYLD